MKTTLILSIAVTLTLGAFAFVRAQDDKAVPESGTETKREAEITAPLGEQVAESVQGIRTDPVVEEKLLGGTSEVTAIPVASVFAEGERFFVLTRNEESGPDFREAEVTLGRTDGLKVEVTEGVQLGDEVLTVSVSQLRFPAFDSGVGAMCGTVVCEGDSCTVTGACKAGTCTVTGTCEAGTCTVTGTCEAGTCTVNESK